MAMLDDYNAIIVNLVPCLIEEALQEMYDTTANLATPEEIKNAKDYVFKRGSATSLLIGADWALWAHEEPNAAEHGDGNQQISQVKNKWKKIES